MRIAVTGASGFLGRHVVPQLAGLGHDVVVLSRRAGSSCPGVRVVAGALQDASAVRALVDGADVLLHLAAAGVSGDRIWPDLVATNIDAQVLLIEAAAAARVSRVVVTGTCNEYRGQGVLPEAPCAGNLDARCDEDSPLQGADPYGTTKAAGGLLVRAMSRDNGLECIYLRLASMYGAGDNDRKFLPSLVRAMLSMQSFDMTGGEQVREWLHVSDAATAVRAFVETENVPASDVLNIGTGEGASIHDVALHVAACARAKPELLRFGAHLYRRNEVHRLVMNVDAAGALGWSPRITWERGLSALVSDLC
jgi:nucleoside-diphosphate-sugar epimerase